MCNIYKRQDATKAGIQEQVDTLQFQSFAQREINVHTKVHIES